MTTSISKRDAAIYAAIDPPTLPEGTQVIRDEGWYQLVNPQLRDSSANEIMMSHVKNSDLDQRIEKAFAPYQEHSLPFKWAIGPMSSPSSLEERISGRASASWAFQGMAIDTTATFSQAEGLEVEAVTELNFEDFLEVNLEGWDQRPFAEQTRKKLLTMIGYPKYQCFLARKNGVPIGSAGTILKEGYGYLVGAVVLEKFRGHGAYKALIQARLTDLNRLGFRFAVTQARSATSAPILERLGFESLYQAKIYRFDPSAKA